MGYYAEKGITVLINGKKVANVQSFHTYYARERTVENNSLKIPPTEIYVDLTRAFFLGDPYRDEINFRGLADFTLEIITPFHHSTYKHCQWLEFIEDMDEKNRLLETIKVASLECDFYG